MRRLALLGLSAVLVCGCGGNEDTPAPDRYPEGVAGIARHLQAIGAHLLSKSEASIPAECEQMKSKAAGLPALAGARPADKLEAIRQACDAIATTCDEMSAAASEGNQEVLTRSLKVLQAQVAVLNGMI